MGRYGIPEIICYADIDGVRTATDRLSAQQRNKLSRLGRAAAGAAIGRFCLQEPSKINLLISNGVITTEPPDEGSSEKTE